MVWHSSELASVLYYLKQENKIIGVSHSDNEIKIINNEDLFDANFLDLLRSKSTIIIDRNLLIAARNIYDNRCSNDRVERFFLLVLSYAMFTDSMIDPAIAIYEGGDNNFISALEDLNKIRTIDNLALENLLKLLFGEIKYLPNEIFEKAKRNTKSIDDQSANENYNKQLTLFKCNYPYFLKAAILLRQNNFSFIEKLREFIKWTQEKYISLNIPFIIVVHSLFYGGGIINKILSTNNVKVIRSVQNATWDATLLSYLKDQSKRNKDRYHLLATNDNKLVEVMRYCFSADDEIEGLYGKDKNEINMLINQNNELCKKKDREKIVRERLDDLANIIKQLEEELLLN